MKAKIKITNQNSNIKLVRASGMFLGVAGFVFVIFTGLMISEAISLQRISKNNIYLNKQIDNLNRDILSKNLDIYNHADKYGFEAKKEYQRYFVEKTLDSKYTYLFR